MSWCQICTRRSLTTPPNPTHVRAFTTITSSCSSAFSSSSGILSRNNNDRFLSSLTKSSLTSSTSPSSSSTAAQKRQFSTYYGTAPTVTRLEADMMLVKQSQTANMLRNMSHAKLLRWTLQQQADIGQERLKHAEQLREVVFRVLRVKSSR